MKDSQGTNIINPETILIIRNLRQKAIHEGKGREFYINAFLTDYALIMHSKKLTPMATLEEHGQQWCLDNNIVGYEFISTSNIGVRKEKESNE